MNVSLTPELAELVDSMVRSARYPSASEVVGEALRLLDERDRDDETKLDELRKLIAVGIEQADRGELLDGEAVFEQIRESIRKKIGPGS